MIIFYFGYGRPIADPEQVLGFGRAKIMLSYWFNRGKAPERRFLRWKKNRPKVQE